MAKSNKEEVSRKARKAIDKDMCSYWDNKLLENYADPLESFWKKENDRARREI